MVTEALDVLLARLAVLEEHAHAVLALVARALAVAGARGACPVETQVAETLIVVGAGAAVGQLRRAGTLNALVARALIVAAACRAGAVEAEVALAFVGIGARGAVGLARRTRRAAL